MLAIIAFAAMQVGALPTPDVDLPLPPTYAASLPTVPGADNPMVTQDNINQTICVSGWTKTVRPTTGYTNQIKFALMDAAGYPRADKRLFELDHDESIEDGGDPASPLNLWLQPYRGKYCTQWCAQDKDVIETLLKRLVCNGTIPLDEARHELKTDWVAAYQLRVKK